MLDLASLEFIKDAGEESIYRCPFCGDSKNPRKGHLYVNKNTQLYYCHRCGEFGYAGERETRSFGKTEKKKEPRKYPDYTAVYGDLLKLLTLHPRHREDLIKRGLSDEFIKARGYKSIPDDKEERKKICTKLAEKHDLSQVPGFIKCGSGYTMVGAPGYLVPVRDLKGRVRCFQIRRDSQNVLTPYGEGSILLYDEGFELIIKCPGKPVFQNGVYVPPLQVGKSVKIRQFDREYEFKVKGPAVIGGDPKYVWFSSHGKLNLLPHYCPGKGSTLWLTEGVLKADVFNYFTGLPTLGFPGTATWDIDLRIIKKFARFVVAYDSEANDLTIKHREELVEALKRRKKRVQVAEWDPSFGKGIDDVVKEHRLNPVRLIQV